MKKTIICIFTVLTFIFFARSVSAGPEEVTLLPLSKWDYKDVDGWGMYAKGGEFSWFAFVLHNPTDTDYYISLPNEVDVAHNSMHEIVNISYKEMVFGGVNILRYDKTKIYFSGDLKLPRQSTYAIFMDITDMTPYSNQWDTDVFFTVGISDKNSSASIDIEGVLAYDALDTLPAELTIIDPDAAVLTASGLCRSYSSAKNKVSFSYQLNNLTSDILSVELAGTLAIEGQQKNAAIVYTECTSGGKSCMDRIEKGMLPLRGRELVVLSGEAVPETQITKKDFYTATSLRYNFNGAYLIPLAVGTSRNTCQGDAPVEIPTATAVSTATPTPAPVTDPVTKVSFCRSYAKKTKTVSFVYSIKNNTSGTIPVELAKTLKIEGQKKAAEIQYTKCVSGSKSCLKRISSGVFKLKPGETAKFYGKATLKENPSKQNFYVKATLRYDYNGKTRISFPLGTTRNTCPAVKPTATPTPTPTPAPVKPIAKVSFCRNYSKKTKTVSIVYTIKNKTSVTIPVELAKTLKVEGQKKTSAIRYTKCVSGGKSCLKRISSGVFKLKPKETVKFYGKVTLKTNPSKQDFYVKTSLRYNYKGQGMTRFSLGTVRSKCSASKSGNAAEDSFFMELAEDGQYLCDVGKLSDDDFGHVFPAAFDNEITGQFDTDFPGRGSFIMSGNMPRDN